MSRELVSINGLDSPLIGVSSRIDRKLRGTTTISHSSMPDFVKHFRELPEEKPKPFSFASMRLIIPRNHWLKSLWDKFISALLAFSTIESLLYVSYRDRGFALNTLDIPVWCVFMIDFLLNFVTDYEDSEGKRIQSYRSIAVKYAKGWFFVDFVSLCPLMFFGFPVYEHYCQLLRILKIRQSLALIDDSWVFAFAMSLTRNPNIDQVIRIKTITRYTVLVLKQLIIVLLFTFCTGAAYFWFSEMMRPVVDEYFEDEFINKKPGDLQRPLNSWYFAITTLVTVGYGDLLPANAEERVFVIGMILLGLGVFSVLVGEFNGVVMEIDALRHNKYQLSELTEWLEECEAFSHRIPSRLRARILAYYENYWKRDRLGTLAVHWWTCATPKELTASPDPLFAELPKHERETMLEVLFDDVFHRYGTLFLEKDGLRFDLALHLQPRVYSNKEVIIDEGEIPKEVVILLAGSVVCGIHSEVRFVNLLSFRKKAVFGDLQILTKSQSPLCYRANDFPKVRAFAIPSKPFKTIVSKVHPKLENCMLAFAWKRFEISKKALISYQEGIAFESIRIRSMTIGNLQSRGRKVQLWEEKCTELQITVTNLREKRRKMKEEYRTKKDRLLNELKNRVETLTEMAHKSTVKSG